MPIFEYNGKKYNVPDDKVDGFKQRKPNATLIDSTPFYLSNQGKTNTLAQNNAEVTSPPASDAAAIHNDFSIPTLDTSVNFDTELQKAKAAQQPQNRLSLGGGKNSFANVAEDAYKAHSGQIKVKDGIKQQVEDFYKTIDRETSGEKSKFHSGNPMAMSSYVDTSPDSMDRVRALSLIRDSQKMISAAENKNKSKAKRIWGGVKDTAFNPENWSFGILDADKNGRIQHILNKADKDEELTAGEQKLMDALVLNLATNAFFGSEIPREYHWGEIAGESAPFMAEFILNPLSSAGKGITKAVAKYGLKRFGTQGAAKLASRAVGAIVGDITSAAAMTGTSGAARTVADAIDRNTGQALFDLDENGKAVYGGREKGDNLFTSVAKAIGSNMIEYYSEMTGNRFGEIGKMASRAPLLKGLQASAFGKWMGRMDKAPLVREMKSLERRGQWSGTVGEWAEEQVGTALNALFVGDSQFSDLADKDQQIDTFMGLFLTGGAMSALNTTGYGVDRVYSAQNLSKHAKAGEAYFTDWSKMKTDIVGMDLQQRADMLKEALRRDDLSLGAKNALNGYIGALTFNESLKSTADELMQKNAEEAQANGARLYAESLQDKRARALQNIHIKKQRYEMELGDLAQITEADMSSAIEADNITPQQLETWNKYNVVRNEYDGLMGALKKEVDNFVAPQIKAVKSAAREDGSVIELNIGSSQHPETVYLAKGNITLNEDGSVNKSALLSPTLTVKDQEGKKRMIGSHHVVSGKTDNVESSSEAIRQMAYEKYVNPLADKMEGKRTFGQGETVEYKDEKGNAHAATIVQEQGQAVVMVDADGKTTTVDKQTLQSNILSETMGDVSVGDQLNVEVEGEIFDAEVEDILDGKAVIRYNTPLGHKYLFDVDAAQLKQIRQTPTAEAVANAHEVRKTDIEGENPASANRIDNVIKKPNAQALEAEKSAFMESLPRIEKGNNAGQLDQSRFTPEQNIKFFEYEYGKERTLDAAEKTAKSLRAQLDKERKKLDANPFNIAQNQKVDAMEAQLKTYADYVHTATQQAQQQQPVQAGAAAPSIAQKWNTAPKTQGIEDVITLANGEKIEGRYVLASAGALSPSHDIARNFAQTEGFPTNEQGRTVNDRDYQADKQAQTLVQQRANQYDERAVQTPVVVSAEGVVLSGNDRTMSGQLAAQQGTDGAYTDYIGKYASRWGFTPEQVAATPNPRVVFVPNETMPYNTATFAKFNAEEKKTQNSLERAIKASKSVPAAAVRSLAGIVEEFPKLSDYYANPTAAKATIDTLLKNGIIGANEVAKLLDGNVLSAEGRSFLETLMLGSVLSEDALRQTDKMRGVRQTLMRAMPQLLRNASLKDYSLIGELNNAIRLLYEAKQTGNKVQLQLMQGNLFEASAEEIYSEAEKVLSNLLENEKDTDFRRIFEIYNGKAADIEAGQADMFEGLLSKPELLQQVLDNYYGRQTQSIGQTRTVDAVDRGGTERNEAGGETAARAEVAQPIPQGINGAETEEVGGVEKVSNDLRGRVERTAGDARKNKPSLPRNEQNEIEQREAELYAKENGLWIPMSDVFNLGSPYKGGNESEIYFNQEEQTLYKVNNLFNSGGSIQTILNSVREHNKKFPETAYQLVGFTGFDGRSIFPVFKQNFVPGNTEASVTEIDGFMLGLGFEKIADYTYTNGEITISDLRPRNVLKDADRDIYVIDNIISINERQEVQKGAENLSKSETISENQNKKLSDNDNIKPEIPTRNEGESIADYAEKVVDAHKQPPQPTASPYGAQNPTDTRNLKNKCAPS